MENKIKILPQTIANKIAAGEVVNRPESVVKELLENSIDSGATEISLIVKDSGKSLIQVIDNGSGMTEEDATMCFLRHSTSKISSVEDLESISTLGFRGEALASICSISQIELKTRMLSEEIGTFIKIEGDEVKQVTKTSCDFGTSISVRNIFYNTPARRNFLKSDNTEFRHIYETFVKLAISNPDISFIFFNNDEKLFDLKKSSLLKRLSELFNINFSESLIKIESGNNLINLSGYISKPNFTKKSKADQYFYLNNRFITSKSLNYAVYSGYDDLIEKGNYPSFFIFINLDPRKVDVNVHPSKLEVKFEDEGAIFGFIKNSVRQALRESNITFDIGFANAIEPVDKETTLVHKEFSNKSTIFTLQKKDSYDLRPFEKRESTANIHSYSEITNELFTSKEVLEPEKENNLFEHKITESEEFNLWQFQNKYIMYQTETGLMIIDQHAAHERVLYEKVTSMLDSQAAFSQQLLIPITINLSKIDYQIVESIKDELKSLGFNFKLIKSEIIELTGLPSDVKIGDEKKIFQELINQYKEYELKLNLDKRDNLAKSFACRSAIKSGDKLARQEMLALIDSLFACTLPYVCPHGRPTIIRLTTDELDKRFSRT
ncbi:MAG: DNA mismatch repair endonuclease MutL [Ignavibacteria bacterium]